MEGPVPMRQQEADEDSQCREHQQEEQDRKDEDDGLLETVVGAALISSILID